MLPSPSLQLSVDRGAREGPDPKQRETLVDRLHTYSQSRARVESLQPPATDLRSQDPPPSQLQVAAYYKYKSVAAYLHSNSTDHIRSSLRPTFPTIKHTSHDPHTYGYNPATIPPQLTVILFGLPTTLRPTYTPTQNQTRDRNHYFYIIPPIPSDRREPWDRAAARRGSRITLWL